MFDHDDDDKLMDMPIVKESVIALVICYSLMIALSVYAFINFA